VTWNFGSRLYDAFVASYTEKVWGIPDSEIHAEWAAQRIKDFSFARRCCARSTSPAKRRPR
jgi:UDP-galactopyranose mutase